MGRLPYLARHHKTLHYSKHAKCKNIENINPISDKNMEIEMYKMELFPLKSNPSSTLLFQLESMGRYIFFMFYCCFCASYQKTKSNFFLLPCHFVFSCIFFVMLSSALGPGRNHRTPSSPSWLETAELHLPTPTPPTGSGLFPWSHLYIRIPHCKS